MHLCQLGNFANTMEVHWLEGDLYVTDQYDYSDLDGRQVVYSPKHNGINKSLVNGLHTVRVSIHVA